MSIILRHQIGTGVGNFPKFFQLNQLDIRMKQQYILVNFDMFTEIDGQRAAETKDMQFVLEDGRVHLTIGGHVIAECNANGDFLTRDLVQPKLDVNGKQQYDRVAVLDENGEETGNFINGDLITETVQVPKERLAEFTKMITAFKPSIFDGFIVPGVEKYLEIIPYA